MPCVDIVEANGGVLCLASLRDSHRNRVGRHLYLGCGIGVSLLMSHNNAASERTLSKRNKISEEHCLQLAL